MWRLIQLPHVAIAAAAETAHEESKGAMMAGWFRDNKSVVWSWAILIAVAAVAFGATRGTQFAQLGVGLLTAAIALLVTMAVFEIIWQTAVRWFDSPNGKPASGSTPKHRQRGQ